MSVPTGPPSAAAREGMSPAEAQIGVELSCMHMAASGIKRLDRG